MEQLSPQHNQFDSLLNQFNSGGLTRSEFLNTILESDQEDPRRGSSIDAVTLLARPEVEERFAGTLNEVEFHSIRSLSYFHKAQIRLSEGEGDVRDDLENAAADSKRAGVEDVDWLHYVNATIAYLENDLPTLRDLSNKIETNKALVENFIAGLEERGAPNYLEDYAKPRK